MGWDGWRWGFWDRNGESEFYELLGVFRVLYEGQELGWVVFKFNTYCCVERVELIFCVNDEVFRFVVRHRVRDVSVDFLYVDSRKDARFDCSFDDEIYIGFGSLRLIRKARVIRAVGARMRKRVLASADFIADDRWFRPEKVKGGSDFATVSFAYASLGAMIISF